MRPRPGHVRPVLLMLAIVLVLLRVLAPASLRHHPHQTGAQGASTPAAQRGLIAPGVAHAHRPGSLPSLELGAYTAEQARAYAAAGLAADGNPAALDALDAPAAAHLIEMQKLLARQHPLARGPSTDATTDPRLGLGAVRGPQAHGGSSAESGPATTSTGAELPTQPMSATRATLDFNHIDQGIQDSPLGPVIAGTNVWAAVRFDPTRGPLQITNASTQPYVLSLYGADFSTLRVNGGLVVPGRSYRIDGSSEIRGDATCGIHIRPAAAIGTQYAGPLLPTGDG